MEHFFFCFIPQSVYADRYLSCRISKTFAKKMKENNFYKGKLSSQMNTFCCFRILIKKLSYSAQIP